MRALRSLWWILVLTLVAAAPAAVASTISVPSNTDVATGQDVVVPITAGAMSGALSFDLEVVTQPAKVTATSVALAGVATGCSLNYVIGPGGDPYGSVPDGHVTISIYCPSTPLSGSGVVAAITYHAIGSVGQVSPLTFARADLDEAPLTQTTGQITIITCDDGNVCTTDSWNGTACVHTNNSLPCNDSNVCTTNDTCSGGVCVGGAAPTTLYVNSSTGNDTNNECQVAASPCLTIQHANDMACNNGLTIQVAAGNYYENVTVTKQVTIAGAGCGSTTVYPFVSNPNCGGGGGGSLCAGGSNIFLIQSNNVTLTGMTIDGDNPGLTSAYNVGGANIDARNGIITNHGLGVYQNLVVHHTCVKNIFLRGMYASSGGSFNFHDNTVQNVQADSGSIAIFNFGGAGSIASNTVSDANDAIASNWSTGTTYTGNIVTSSGSGVHSDNNGGSGGTGDVITGNTVSNCKQYGYGIWTFASYVAILVQNNTVTSCDVGLASSGRGAAAGVTTFDANVVSGTNAAGSAGVYLTTWLWGWGYADSSTVFTNNIIRNNEAGFYLEETTGKNLSVSATCNRIIQNVWGVQSSALANPSNEVFHDNVIAGNSTAGADGSAIAAGNMNFQSNWWGCAAGPGNLGCDTVTTHVDATLPLALPPACAPCAGAPDGQACNDSNACTTNDVCTAGLCVGGAAPNCDDSNACTADSCDTALGCVHTAVANGTPCGDPSSGSCDNADSCLSGVCQANHIADGTACPDDGNVCTTDTCGSGVCTHPAGNAGTVCRAAVDQCDAAETCTGTSATCPADSKQPNGTSCEDGSLCTLSDSCVDGVCVGGPPPVCDDSNVCTTDTCNDNPPTVTPGFVPGPPTGTKISVIGVRFRSFNNNVGESEAYLGVPDLGVGGNRTSLNFNPTQWGNTTVNGQVNDITWVYDKVLDKLTMTVDTHTGPVQTLTYPASGTLTAALAAVKGITVPQAALLLTQMNIMQITVHNVSGNAATVTLSNVVVNGTPLGYPLPTSVPSFPTVTAPPGADVPYTVRGLDCTNSFSMTARITLTGTFTSNEAGRIALDVGYDPLSPQRLAGCIYTPGNGGTVCRAEVPGGCDIQEACTGTSSACPADAVSPVGTVCRAPAGECDAQETCTGTNTCPLDAKLPNGTACTDDGNVCSLDQCNGTSDLCQHPAGNAGTPCRASAGVCDVAENCSGTSTSCPDDGFQPSSTVCNPSAGPCDLAENCTGSSAACPADVFKPASVVCRPAVGVCDVTESCTGSAAGCPSDAKQPTSTVCRPSAGDCDVAESCDGSDTECPPDGFQPSTLLCRAAPQVCDVPEYCAGGAAATAIYDSIPSPLPPNLPSYGFEATSMKELGDGVTFLAGAQRFVTNVTVTMSAWALHSSYPSMPTTPWSHPITLKIYSVDHSGPNPAVGTLLKTVTQSFPIPWRPEADPTCAGGTAWRAANNSCYNGLAFDITFNVNFDLGTTNEVIFSVAYNTSHHGPAPLGVAGPYDSLNVALHSTATNGPIIGTDTEPNAGFVNSTWLGFYDPASGCPGGTFCRDLGWIPYTPAIRFQATSSYPVDCPADAFKPTTEVCRPSAGVCDVADNCPGNGPVCTADVKSTAVCRAAAGVCDAAESCNGGNDCPTDVYLPSSTVCRPSAGQCDVADNCTGSGVACPADAKLPNGTACNDGDACTAPDTCQSGLCSSVPKQVTPRNMYGWAFVNDNNGSAGTGAMVAGPGTPPAGTGSAHLFLNSVPADAPPVYADRQLLSTQAYAGTRLSQITALQYSAYRASVDGSNGLEITLQFDMDYNLDDTYSGWQGRLVFEPAVSQGYGGFIQGTWYTLNPMAGRWYASRAPYNGACSMASPCTWNQVLTNWPSAGISVAAPGVGYTHFKAGGPWPNFDGNVDAFTIGVSGLNTTWNFELTEQCDDTNVCTVDSCNPASGCVNTAGNAGTVCRAAAGVCDLVETCTGTDVNCPGDAKSTLTCRWQTDVCDAFENCDGVHNDCPPDGYLPPSTLCRNSAGACDVDEYCTGAGPACPGDAYKASSVLCRPKVGECDVDDYCPGTGAACSADAKSTAVCRPAAGFCDVAESCTGGNECPADGFQPSSLQCRGINGDCDVAENCAGAGSAAKIYDSVVVPLPGNMPSLGYEATSTSEFGDLVTLAGTDRVITDVTLTMSAWGKHSEYPLMPTTPWSHPITLNIYSVDRSGLNPAVGTLLHSVTQTFAIPWRPEPDPTCPGGTAWRGADNQCYNGFAFDITFHVNYDIGARTELIYGIVYNTADYGPAPIHAPGPYNSLNVALHDATVDPVIGPGSDTETTALFWKTSHLAWYSDPACDGTTLCRDWDWTPYTPAIRFSAVSSYQVDCPTDLFVSSSVVCRAATDVCDLTENCPGTGPACPGDAKAPSGTGCDDTLYCSVNDACNGSGACLGAARDCSDSGPGYVCTIDSCNEVSDSCDHVAGSCTINGKVLYYRDATVPVEPSTKPVPGETIKRTSSLEADTTSLTDALGQYGFPSEAGNIVMTPLALHETSETRCKDAISATDASRMSQYAVHLITLTDNQKVAGDVSNNGLVTSFDAALTAQAAAGTCLTYAFPVRTATLSDWAFRPISKNYTPISQNENFDFLGIFYGDVTGNWDSLVLLASTTDQVDPNAPTFPEGTVATVPSMAVREGAPAELYLASGPTLTPEGHWRAVFGMHNSDGILGLDLTLLVDPAQVRIQSVERTGIASTFGVYSNDSDEGRLVSMYNVAAMTGSGEFLVVTYDITMNATGSLPFGVNASANEGLIPVALGQGIPRPGTHDPEVQVDTQ